MLAFAQYLADRRLVDEAHLEEGDAGGGLCLLKLDGEARDAVVIEIGGVGGRSRQTYLMREFAPALADPPRSC